jgi:hypothetical protein
MAKTHLLQVSGILGQRYITYYSAMVPDIGLKAAIILGKFIYWHNSKHNQPDGYFFKTFEKLYQETGITVAAQKPALKVLKQRGLISADKYDYRHRRLFKVNMDEVRKYAMELSKNPTPIKTKPTYQSSENRLTEKIQSEKSQTRFKEKTSNNLEQTRNSKTESLERAPRPP